MKYTEELENKIRVNPPPEKTKLYTKVDLLLQSTQLIGTEVFMTLSTEQYSDNKMALTYLCISKTIHVIKCACLNNSHTW